MKIFWNFLPKGGGGLANSEISLYKDIRIRIYQKKLGPPNCWEGAGGSQNFVVFLKNTSFFLLMPPLILNLI